VTGLTLSRISVAALILPLLSRIEFINFKNFDILIKLRFKFKNHQNFNNLTINSKFKFLKSKNIKPE